MNKKTEKVELRLPNRTVMALDQVAELAGASPQDVVKVMLALYAVGWFKADERPQPGTTETSE